MKLENKEEYERLKERYKEKEREWRSAKSEIDNADKDLRDFIIKESKLGDLLSGFYSMSDLIRLFERLIE